MAETINASVSGIDGSGKSTTVGLVSQMLAKEVRVGVLASSDGTCCVLEGDKKRFVLPGVSSKLIDLYRKGQRLGNRLIVFEAAMKLLAMREKTIRPFMVENFRPDVVLSDRDVLVDSIVLFDSYWSGRLPMWSMVSVVEAVAGESVTDELYLLSLRPETAFKRICGEKGDDHESLESLRRMSGKYPGVIAGLIGMGKIKQWRTTDAEQPSQDVAWEIFQALVK